MEEGIAHNQLLLPYYSEMTATAAAERKCFNICRVKTVYQYVNMIFLYHINNMVDMK